MLNIITEIKGEKMRDDGIVRVETAGNREKHLRPIVFDVDGVLLDSMPLWENSANRYLQEMYGITAPAELDRACATLSLLEAGRYILEQYPELPLTAEQIAAEVPAFLREHYVKVPGKPEMVSTVRTLVETGYSLYLATASEEENVRGALSNLGVWDCFQGIYTCTEIGWSKSYPAYYEEVARRIGAPAHTLILVEDSLHSMITAKKTGLTVVGVYDSASTQQAPEIRRVCDGYLEHLGQLPDWLNRERRKDSENEGV
jgi:beta-phosphoglucomutase-like phosphatase (HAD superfamily)